MRTWTHVVPYDRASEIKGRGGKKPSLCSAQIHVSRVLTYHKEKKRAQRFSMKVRVAVKQKYDHVSPKGRCNSSSTPCLSF